MSQIITPHCVSSVSIMAVEAMGGYCSARSVVAKRPPQTRQTRKDFSLDSTRYQTSTGAVLNTSGFCAASVQYPQRSMSATGERRVSAAAVFPLDFSERHRLSIESWRLGNGGLANAAAFGDLFWAPSGLFWSDTGLWLAKRPLFPLAAKEAPAALRRLLSDGPTTPRTLHIEDSYRSVYKMIDATSSGGQAM